MSEALKEALKEESKSEIKGMRVYRFVNKTDAVMYEPIYFDTPNPHGSCRKMLNQAQGRVEVSPEDAGGVCDLLTEDGDSVDEVFLSKKAIKYLYWKLKMRRDRRV